MTPSSLVLFLIFMSLLTCAAPFDLSTIINPLLPAIPFVPFFPVTAADFAKRDTPASFLREKEAHSSREQPVLVCLGDSLTHGSVSSNWVERLAQRLPSYSILNAGKNSETVAALRLRIDEVVKVQPDAVTVLIGTNDLIGSLDSSASCIYRLRLWNKQKESPSLDAHARELEAIVWELDDRLDPATKIAILSPPPLGEGGVDGIAWKEGTKMAKTCVNIVSELSSARVSYLPLFETTKKEMADAIQDDVREFNFWESLPFIIIVVPWQLLLGMSFSDIMAMNGYKYTLDGVHFGDEFATTVENLVYDWIKQ